MGVMGELGESVLFGNSGRIIIHSLFNNYFEFTSGYFSYFKFNNGRSYLYGNLSDYKCAKKSNDLVRFLIISIIFCGMFLR